MSFFWSSYLLLFCRFAGSPARWMGGFSCPVFPPSFNNFTHRFPLLSSLDVFPPGGKTTGGEAHPSSRLIYPCIRSPRGQRPCYLKLLTVSIKHNHRLITLDSFCNSCRFQPMESRNKQKFRKCLPFIGFWGWKALVYRCTSISRVIVSLFKSGLKVF